jgi:hypothetical protein
MKTEGVSEVFTPYSRRIHALPSPLPPFFEPKIFEKSQKYIILTYTLRNNSQKKGLEATSCTHPKQTFDPP